MLKKTNRVNILFDFYGQLLNDRQKQSLEMYYKEDLSLSEIAELMGVSRQAIFDQLKRTETSLEKYEQKLHLLVSHVEREKKFAQLIHGLESKEWDRTDILLQIKSLAKFDLE